MTSGDYVIEVSIVPGQMKGIGKNLTKYYYDVKKREKFIKP